MSEPMYVRVLRGLLHLTEPNVLDALIVGIVLGAGGGAIAILWWTGN